MPSLPVLPKPGWHRSLLHTHCLFSYQVFDGASSEAPLLRKLCGTQQPAAITSSGNLLFIRLRSSTATQHRGFHARFAEGELLLCHEAQLPEPGWLCQAQSASTAGSTGYSLYACSMPAWTFDRAELFQVIKNLKCQHHLRFFGWITKKHFLWQGGSTQRWPLTPPPYRSSL